MSQGFEFEAEVSKIVHSSTTPLLISPKLLNKYGAGQIDVAAIKNGKIHLVEAKISGKISFKQQNRLKKSAMLALCWTNLETKLWLARKLLPKRVCITTLNV